jgi:hypothetical protein
LPLSKYGKHIVAGPLSIRARFNILLAKARGDLVFDGWVKIRRCTPDGCNAGAGPDGQRPAPRVVVTAVVTQTTWKDRAKVSDHIAMTGASLKAETMIKMS